MFISTKDLATIVSDKQVTADELLTLANDRLNNLDQLEDERWESRGVDSDRIDLTRYIGASGWTTKTVSNTDKTISVSLTNTDGSTLVASLAPTSTNTATGYAGSEKFSLALTVGSKNYYAGDTFTLKADNSYTETNSATANQSGTNTYKTNFSVDYFSKNGTTGAKETTDDISITKDLVSTYTNTGGENYKSDTTKDVYTYKQGSVTLSSNGTWKDSNTTNADGSYTSTSEGVGNYSYKNTETGMSVTFENSEKSKETDQSSEGTMTLKSVIFATPSFTLTSKGVTLSKPGHIDVNDGTGSDVFNAEAVEASLLSVGLGFVSTVDNTITILDPEGIWDTVRGGAGNDTIIGGKGSDLLDGGIGNDSINAGEGDDWIQVSFDGLSDDSVSGGAATTRSFGIDTVDGGAGSDVLDLNALDISLTERGETTYTVTGTVTNFTINYNDAETGDKSRIDVKNVEKVSIGGEIIDTAKFLYPNSTEIDGGTLLTKLAAGFQNTDVQNFPLSSIIDVTLLEQSWKDGDTQKDDPDSLTQSLSFTGTDKSTLTYDFSQSDPQSAAQSYKSSFSFKSARNDLLSSSYETTYTETLNTKKVATGGAYTEKSALTWSYLGDDVSDKSDDVNLKATYTTTDKWKTLSNGGISSTSDDAFSYAITMDGISLEAQAASKTEYSNDSTGSETKNVEQLTFAKYAFADTNDKYTISFSGSSKTDYFAETQSLDLKAITIATESYKSVTASLKAQLKSLDQFEVDLLPNTDLATTKESLQTVMEPFVTNYANSVTILATDGVDFDAGAGNDTVMGAAGDDKLNGGEGNDSISGGKGNDTLVASLGADKLDGGDGKDVLDLTQLDWSIEDGKGDSSKYTVSGTEKSFSFVDKETGVKTTVSGVEDVLLTDGLVSVNKFLNPNLVTLSGAEFVTGLQADWSSEDGPYNAAMPLIDVTTYSFFDWNTQDFNPTEFKGKNLLAFKALDENGKTLATANFKSDSTGFKDTGGKNSGSYDLTVASGDYKGDKLSAKWTMGLASTFDKSTGDVLSLNNGGSVDISFESKAGTVTDNTDDIRISESRKWTSKQSTKGTAVTYEDGSSLKYAYSYGNSTDGLTLAGSYTYKSTRTEKDGELTVDKSSFDLKGYTLTQIVDGTKEVIKFGAKNETNYIDNEKDSGLKVSITGFEYAGADYSLKAAKFSSDYLPAYTELAPLGFSPGDDLSTTMSGLKEAMLDFALLGDNTISVLTEAGLDSVYGGDGKDTITGNKGNDGLYGELGDDKLDGQAGDDTLSGGGGADELKGGSGNDTFILNFEDYDFSDAKNLKVTKITDFKYSASDSGERDTLVTQGFYGAYYDNIAEAKEASDAGVVVYFDSGKLWYVEDNSDGKLSGALNFATITGLSTASWEFS